MRLLHDYRELQLAPSPGRVVTVGNFDGVHLGHRAVLGNSLRQARERGFELAVLTFEPNPVERLRPGAVACRLTEPERKYELLAEAGADLVLAQHFDVEFAAMKPEDFARQVLADALQTKLVIVGQNFRFGRDRGGNPASLRAYGESLGFEVDARELISSDGACISSSRIRELIAAGDVALAARLLGRPHAIEGEVIRGKREGRQLGFPTANLGGLRTLAPGTGVYAARWSFGAEEGMAAVYIGFRPTLGHGFAVEAHLLDHDGDLYGRLLRLHFIERLRGEVRFADQGLLAVQLGRDVQAARALLSKADG